MKIEKTIYFEMTETVFKNNIKHYLQNISKSQVDDFADFLYKMSEALNTGHTKLFNAMQGTYPNPEFNVDDEVLINYSAVSNWSVDKEKSKSLLIDGEFIEGTVVEYSMFSNHPYRVMFRAYTTNGDEPISKTEAFKEEDLQLNNQKLTPINRI